LLPAFRGVPVEGDSNVIVSARDRRRARSCLLRSRSAICRRRYGPPGPPATSRAGVERGPRTRSAEADCDRSASYRPARALVSVARMSKCIRQVRAVAALGSPVQQRFLTVRSAESWRSGGHGIGTMRALGSGCAISARRTRCRCGGRRARSARRGRRTAGRLPSSWMAGCAAARS
jgi:hypothetical protein